MKLQPILVVENPLGSYDVVAGQLRLEACKLLGWETIPAVVRTTHALTSEHSEGV